jgi:hypothetical protein
MLNDREGLGLKPGSVFDEVPIGNVGAFSIKPTLGRFGAGVSSSERVRSMTSGCRFWPREAVDMDPLAEMVLLGVCTENDLGVPPPIVELRARAPETSIKSSESSSLSEYPVAFAADVSTDHDPSG